MSSSMFIEVPTDENTREVCEIGSPDDIQTIAFDNWGKLSADDGVSLRIATSLSWLVNWILLFAKIAAVILSNSKAVTAALVDSAVDLVSQGVLSLAETYIMRHSPDYPVGRSRLEALSVMVCAFIMSFASIEVIQFSLVDIFSGLNGNLPNLEVGPILYIILCFGTALKLALFIYCRYVNAKLKSDMLDALAEDHINDVISNSAAIVTAAIAYNTAAWWIDPVGAILISLVIIYRWGSIMSEQVKKIVGHTAPPDFIFKVEEIAREHDSRLAVDCTRAYHFGARYNVEMEIVLPGSMTVIDSHDIALALQHKIEAMVDVERAFVHVDHQERDGLEHKVERELVRGNSNGTSVGGSGDSSSVQIRSGSASELRARRATAVAAERSPQGAVIGNALV